MMKLPPLWDTKWLMRLREHGRERISQAYAQQAGMSILAINQY
jgi:hypothetical protein